MSSVPTSLGTKVFGPLCAIIGLATLGGLGHIVILLKNQEPERVVFNATWNSNGVLADFHGPGCDALPCLESLLARLPPTR